MPERKPEAKTQRRAVKLIRLGLTPQVVTDAMCDPDTMHWICRRAAVKPQDVEWLAERWPVQVVQGHCN